MVVRVLLGLLGLFHLANGLIMLAFPTSWAAAVVHLTAPDRLHVHFIVDIGLAFAASGTGLLLAARRGAGAGIWALAGATWPLLHGLFHIVAWIKDGQPHGTDVLNEGVGVILAGLVGMGLAIARYRKGDA